MPRRTRVSPADPVYEQALVQVVAAIATAQIRGGQWLEEYPTAAHDLAWRRAAEAEFASWRGFLDLLPTEVPPQYDHVQVRLVRWAAAFANAGDRYAQLMATGDHRVLMGARQQVEELHDLYWAMQEALIEIKPDW